MSGTAPASSLPVVVGIGASAGGIEALQAFLEACPDEPDIAFVVVTHLPPDQPSELASVLQPHTPMTVTQVSETTGIKANHVYVAPPDRAVAVKGQALQLRDLEGEGSDRRAPINQFFRSLAQAEVHPVGVVLSGSGSDGAAGLRAIEEAGGLTAVQDPLESAHASMPKSAIEASRVDLTLPADKLPRRLTSHRAALRRVQAPSQPEELATREREMLRDIFSELRVETGLDFSGYKRSTVLRRIQRRLHVHQLSSLEAYVEHIQAHPSEIQELRKDLLISVSSFFRDPKAFGSVREEVVPTIFSKRDGTAPIRAWVPGCATGEEAYSITMILLEAALKRGLTPEAVRVFATDVDEGALRTARQGQYPESVAADIPERYLNRFTRQDKGRLIVRKATRERIIFSPHNLLSDPPFSKLDLISCRNVLIYLRRDFQESVFDLFSYALNESGFLFLGSSESLQSDASDGFHVFNKKRQIYRRASSQTPAPQLPVPDPAAWPPASLGRADFSQESTPDQATSGRGPAAPGSSAGALHRQLLEQHAPPSALVASDYTFLRLSPTAGRYLVHSGGAPNTNIIELVRPELQIDLREALRDAFADGQPTHTSPIEVELEGTSEHVRLAVHPADGDAAGRDRAALVMFIRAGSNPQEVLGSASAPDAPSGDRSEVDQLREELQETRRRLRATIDDHESSKQEMRAANEELRSMNEEYKSMAEELETNKEELQSVNEELRTVNRELEAKVEELRKANSDLSNLILSTDIGTLFLDRDLRIRRFTPPVDKLFNVQAGDEGRPVSDLTHQLDYERLFEDARHVLEAPSDPIEREVRGGGSAEGQWFLVRVHPYRSADDAVEGVVITFVDITERKREEALRESKEEAARLKDAMLANMSHEIRAPLSPIIGYAEMLQEQLGDPEAEFAEHIFDSAQRLQETLEAMLSLSKLESGAYELRPERLDLAALIEEVAGELSPRVQEAGVKLSAELPNSSFEGRYDEHALRRVLSNLLRNAIKFTPEGGHVEVRARLEEDALTLEVEDSGIGISEEAQENIFTPFEQESKGPTREHEGTGLGLAIVREFVEVMDGTIGFESEKGEGTCFTVRLPRRSEGASSGRHGNDS